MKKVISYSLWGNNPTYTIGAIKNAELASHFYPDFECWFYVHKDTVPHEIIEKLSSFKNTKIILREGDLKKNKPMMWRFESIDDPDVEINLSRDTDTRILRRELKAVYSWIHSGKLFHIMRDHPYHHHRIMGGMFGTRKIPGVEWKKLMDLQEQIGEKDYDQIFLARYIYNLVKKNALIHASFHKFETDSIDFPVSYDKDYRFVGEYVYSDESRTIEYNLCIKDALNKKNMLQDISNIYI